MRIPHAISLVRQMGPAWVVGRAGYSLKTELGWFERRFPVTRWDTYALDRVAQVRSGEEIADRLRSQSPRLLGGLVRSDYAPWLSANSPDAVPALVEELARADAGYLRAFDSTEVHVGNPPVWTRHTESGDVWPMAHWSRLASMGGSDVKWLWEIGRFEISYKAVRAWWATGDDACAETFWRFVESWRLDNPPNAGPHWMCGQECALRSIAWCFGLFGLLDAPASTANRVAMLVEMLAAHATRIESNIGFAISQKNNHAINEALGLLVIGTMLPMLDDAARWSALGRRILEQEAGRQIYADGAYVQHSLNYHRFVVESLSLALLIGDISESPLSDELRERFARAVDLLYQLTDESGRAPNYGSNDGGRLLRLDSCDFEDYRPALALGFWAASQRRVFDPGPWDEPLWWLGGSSALLSLRENPDRIDVVTRIGGYHTVRGRDTWAMLRCCSYDDRPAQADMLHVDVWWRGKNIIADPGTFSYDGAPPWNNGLARTRVHNTVEVDDLDQMERGVRFTWFDWTRSHVVRNTSDDDARIFEGEHTGYSRRLGVDHRRCVVLLGDSTWIIVDDVFGTGEHLLSSQWLLPQSTVRELVDSTLRVGVDDGDFELTFVSIAASGVERGRTVTIVEPGPDDTLGWVSTRYQNREAALGVLVRDRHVLPARLVTVLSLRTPCEVDYFSPSALTIRANDECWHIELYPFPYDRDGSMISSLHSLSRVRP